MLYWQVVCVCLIWVLFRLSCVLIIFSEVVWFLWNVSFCRCRFFCVWVMLLLSSMNCWCVVFSLFQVLCMFSVIWFLVLCRLVLVCFCCVCVVLICVGCEFGDRKVYFRLMLNVQFGLVSILLWWWKLYWLNVKICGFSLVCCMCMFCLVCVIIVCRCVICGCCVCVVCLKLVIGFSGMCCMNSGDIGCILLLLCSSVVSVVFSVVRLFIVFWYLCLVLLWVMVVCRCWVWVVKFLCFSFFVLDRWWLRLLCMLWCMFIVCLVRCWLKQVWVSCMVNDWCCILCLVLVCLWVVLVVCCVVGIMLLVYSGSIVVIIGWVCQLCLVNDSGELMLKVLVIGVSEFSGRVRVFWNCSLCILLVIFGRCSSWVVFCRFCLLCIVVLVVVSVLEICFRCWCVCFQFNVGVLLLFCVDVVIGRKVVSISVSVVFVWCIFVCWLIMFMLFQW